MHNCKNCNKEIPDNLNYCNEQCLRQHLEKKKAEKEKQNQKPEPETQESLKEYAKRKQKEKKNQKSEPEKQPLIKQELKDFHAGSGSTNRKANILLIREMISQGISREEITKKLNLSFTREKVEEYLRIAKEDI